MTEFSFLREMFL